jgi:hypothetical protein
MQPPSADYTMSKPRRQEGKKSVRNFGKLLLDYISRTLRSQRHENLKSHMVTELKKIFSISESNSVFLDYNKNMATVRNFH